MPKAKCNDKINKYAKMRKYLIALVIALTFCLQGAEAPKAEKVRWVNLDESHYLGGWKVQPEDLEGAIVLLMQFPIQNIPVKDVKTVLSKTRSNMPDDIRFFEVCGVSGEKKSLAMYERLVKGSKIRDFPAYEGLTVADGEAKEEEFRPGYVVVDHEGRVAYRGNNMKAALGIVRKIIKKLPPSDPYFGLVAPVKNSSVTNLVVEGRSLAPVYAALRKSAAGNDAEAAEEAKRLIAALDQTCRLRISAAVRDSRNAPGKASLTLERTLKMWPKAKDDDRVAKMEARFMRLEDLSKLVRMRLDLERLSALNPETARPAEKKKALAEAQALLAKAAKLKTSAKDGGARDEAAHLENDFTALVSRFE